VLVGPEQWYEDRCIQVIPLSAVGEPSSPIWVSGEVGGCQGLASGVGAVPVCAGNRTLVVLLPTGFASELSGAVDSTELGVSVDVSARADGYETMLVTGTVDATRPASRWPAASAADGASLTFTADDAGEATCT